MRDVLRRMARAQRTPMHAMQPAQARAAYEAGADVLEVPRRNLARVEDATLPARDGYALPVRIYADRTDGLQPALLYLHGGGFTVGSIRTHDVLCRELAARSGAAVVSLEYRLAPEHRFPTAFEDCWDALQWLHQQGVQWGLDGQRLAVGGDSAGGTLAAACALQARDMGLALALQLLIYPGTCAHQDTDSHQRYAHGLVLEQDAVQWFFNHYVRSSADREDWRFAPLLADDLEGLAPAWVGLAELDPLFDEGLAYADQMRMAQVPVALEVYQGVTHEFIKMGRVIAEARQAHADMAQAMAQALGTAPLA